MSYDPKQEAEEAVGDRRPGVDVTNQAEAADWLRDELGRGELSGVFL